MPPIPMSVHLAAVFEREALEEAHWGAFCHINYLELTERIRQREYAIANIQFVGNRYIIQTTVKFLREIQLGDIGKQDWLRAMVVESNQRLRLEGVATSETEYTDLDIPANSIDAAVMFHLVIDLLGFVLFMHQQIPSIRILGGIFGYLERLFIVDSLDQDLDKWISRLILVIGFAFFASRAPRCNQ
ncbi:hypothetical protein Tco_1532017 [Tanacetum coccineum]